METQQIFSRMFVIAKKIKELFTPTLNGIAARVKCVSSTTVVAKSKLLKHTKTTGNKETRSDFLPRLNNKL